MAIREYRKKLDDYLQVQCADQAKYERLWLTMPIVLGIESVVISGVMFTYLKMTR